MPVQTICIEDKPFVVIPKREYEELLVRAAGQTLPLLPEPDENGNRPAKESIRVLIARGIIARRIAAGWTQEDLAKKAKVSTETISRLEGAKHRPQAATVARIDEAFKEAGV